MPTAHLAWPTALQWVPGRWVCVVRGAWCVVRGAWCVVRGAWCVGRGAWGVVRGVWGCHAAQAAPPSPPYSQPLALLHEPSTCAVDAIVCEGCTSWPHIRRQEILAGCNTSKPLTCTRSPRCTHRSCRRCQRCSTRPRGAGRWGSTRPAGPGQRRCRRTPHSRPATRWSSSDRPCR
jgi:hypothetical protein